MPFLPLRGCEREETHTLRLLRSRSSPAVPAGAALGFAPSPSRESPRPLGAGQRCPGTRRARYGRAGAAPRGRQRPGPTSPPALARGSRAPAPPRHRCGSAGAALAGRDLSGAPCPAPNLPGPELAHPRPCPIPAPSLPPCASLSLLPPPQCRSFRTPLSAARAVLFLYYLAVITSLAVRTAGFSIQPRRRLCAARRPLLTPGWLSGGWAPSALL